jgi:hypothetical protein
MSKLRLEQFSSAGKPSNYSRSETGLYAARMTNRDAQVKRLPVRWDLTD